MKSSKTELDYKITNTFQHSELLHQSLNYIQMFETLTKLGMTSLYKKELENFIKEIDRCLKKPSVRMSDTTLMIRDAIYHFDTSIQEKLLHKDFIVYFSSYPDPLIDGAIIKGCFVVKTSFMWKKAIKMEDFTINVWNHAEKKYNSHTFNDIWKINEAFNPTPKAPNSN
jgi:hypothetical protein